VEPWSLLFTMPGACAYASSLPSASCLWIHVPAGLVCAPEGAGIWAQCPAFPSETSPESPVSPRRAQGLEGCSAGAGDGWFAPSCGHSVLAPRDFPEMRFSCNLFAVGLCTPGLRLLPGRIGKRGSLLACRLQCADGSGLRG